MPAPDGADRVGPRATEKVSVDATFRFLEESISQKRTSGALHRSTSAVGRGGRGQAGKFPTIPFFAHNARSLPFGRRVPSGSHS